HERRGILRTRNDVGWCRASGEAHHQIGSMVGLAALDTTLHLLSVHRTHGWAAGKVNFSSTSWPSRLTTMVTSRPAAWIASTYSSRLATAFPATLTITSPVLKPAFSAIPPSTTSATFKSSSRRPEVRRPPPPPGPPPPGAIMASRESRWSRFAIPSAPRAATREECFWYSGTALSKVSCWVWWVWV